MNHGEHKKVVCPVTGMEFVFVKGGVFRMGNVLAKESPHDDVYFDNLPVHEVEVADFYLGKYPVTQAEWVKIMGNNPSEFKGDNHPVTDVSWNDAQKFIRRLNGRSYQGFRLPSEAEWEYAARSGGTYERWAGTSNEEEVGEYAWYRGTSRYPQPAGRLKPNGIGLYDMSGNVWEWCEDRYAPFYAKNPKGPGSGVRRVLRGCCSITFPIGMQVAERFHAAPDETCFGPGFRLALSTAAVLGLNHDGTAQDSDFPAEITCPVTGMEFVLVKGGVFQMGNVFAAGDGREGGGYDYSNSNELPVHEVELDDFFIGRYPVTQAEWVKVMGNNPSRYAGGQYPVTDVSWNDAQEFITCLNRQAGQEYRLPTEAEWEYAARSRGKAERWAGTSDEEELGEYAWYGADRVHPVGNLKPNGLGLYDMCGNVWEWCADLFAGNYYAESPRRNPRGPGVSNSGRLDRVIRGGSYHSHPCNMRVASRNSAHPAWSNFLHGFRLVFKAPL